MDVSRSELAVLPLRNLILFPGVVLPVDVGRHGSLRLVEELAGRGRVARLAVSTQRDPQTEDPGPDDLVPVGVQAQVLKIVKLGESRVTVVLRGESRIRLVEFTRRTPYMVAFTEPVLDRSGDPVAIEATSMALREAAKQLVQMSASLPDETIATLEQIKEPGRLADVAAAHLDLPSEERLAALTECEVHARLELVLRNVRHRIEVLRVKEKIDTQVREEFSRHQHEIVLRQKLKAIEGELGEMGEGIDDTAELEGRIAQAQMPEDVEKTAKKQLGRLRMMPTASPEYTVARTYLDWLIELPWAKESPDRLDLGAAQKVLDGDHYDLEKVKKRVLEYLAVRKLAPGKKGPLLCLLGPPGVGKTSLGRSIARALGREFCRVSLGGIRDEAEIRGHRRTYVGALPGRMIQSIRRVGVRNPVFMLDEVDKMGTDFRGDPSSALLEVLDPEQNVAFSDHYLEVPFDMSRVMFITTANQLDPIAPALRDRLEVIELPGYTHEEKRNIARRYLLPKQLLEHGISETLLSISDGALDKIISSFTREAGVRSLEREIAAIFRGVAVKLATKEDFGTRIDAEDLAEYLGPTRFQSEIAERTEVAGVATGLAWTPTGGDLLFLEVTRMPGKANLVLTGQLGNVMKESAQAALSYVRAHAATLGIDPLFFDKSDLHVHVPAGAIPKDGPSAGVALLLAIVSLLTGKRVRHDVAVTGEITLRGNVLSVGGIKEKVLAAHRAGVKRVLLPERNRNDLVDIPAEVQRDLDIRFCRRIDEIIPLSLES